MRKDELETCCKSMEDHIFVIDQAYMNDGGNTGDNVIHYLPKYNSYHIPIYHSIKFDENEMPIGLDSKSSMSIKCCPWCGTTLPKDLSDEWFEEIEKLGCQDSHDDIPEKYKSWDWWRNK